MGDREEGRAVEVPLRFVAGLMGRISTSLTDFWAQDAEVVSRAAVHASLLCVRGEREKGVWSLTQSEIVRLGRTEWPMGGAEKQ